MERKEFYHMYSNGDDAKNFIVCEDDFRFEFNLIAVCAFCSGVTVLGFSLEDTHLHTLLYGTRAQVYAFKSQFERSSIRHISVTRGSRDGVVLDCSVDLITDEEHLISVAAYVIIQPTKDGKPVQYYDYKWGERAVVFQEATLCDGVASGRILTYCGSGSLWRSEELREGGGQWQDGVAG